MSLNKKQKDALIPHISIYVGGLIKASFCFKLSLIFCAFSSVAERRIHIAKVAGSIPAMRTQFEYFSE